MDRQRHEAADAGDLTLRGIGSWAGVEVLLAVAMVGGGADSYQIKAFTHPYHGGYGGPEIEEQQPAVKSVSLAEDGLSVKLGLEKLDRGFVYELDLIKLRSQDGEPLVHRNAFYTVNEVPSR
ncbi:MAG: hypothetical protein DWH91_02805 [Planctomycetota bacterium]|nr:MAG: hypothetical protein DWH91_02805 [Planctomycetota bacterium]